LFDYIFLPLISYTHNGDDTPYSNTASLSCAACLDNFRILKFLVPSGPVLACTEIAWPLIRQNCWNFKRRWSYTAFEM